MYTFVLPRREQWFRELGSDGKEAAADGGKSGTADDSVTSRSVIERVVLSCVVSYFVCVCVCVLCVCMCV